MFPMPFSLDGVPADILARARIPDSDVLAVAAVEIRPGNPRVLHHADVFVDISGEAERHEKAEGGNGYSSFGTPGFVPAAVSLASSHCSHRRAAFAPTSPPLIWRLP